MIYRNREVTLNLRSVQVESQCPICPGRFEQIRNQLRGNWNARLIFAVLARVAIIRNNRGDAPSRGTLKSINHHQQFHQVEIHRMAAWLYHKNIGPANILENLKINLTVAEFSQGCLTHLRA